MASPFLKSFLWWRGGGGGGEGGGVQYSISGENWMSQENSGIFFFKKKHHVKFGVEFDA